MLSSNETGPAIDLNMGLQPVQQFRHFRDSTTTVSYEMGQKSFIITQLLGTNNEQSHEPSPLETRSVLNAVVQCDNSFVKLKCYRYLENSSD